MLIFVSEKKQAEAEMMVKEEVTEERKIEKVIFPTTWICIFNVKLRGWNFIIPCRVCCCCCYVMSHNKVRSTYLGSKASFQWLKYTPQGLYF